MADGYEPRPYTDEWVDVSSDFSPSVTGVSIKAYTNGRLMNMQVGIPKNTADATVVAQIPSKYLPKIGLCQFSGGIYYHQEDFQKIFILAIEPNGNLKFRCSQVPTGTWGLSFTTVYAF